MLPELYPLKLQAIYKPTIWGGHNLAALKPDLPATQLIGESWEAYDDCLIQNGTLTGRSLHQAVAAWGRLLVGTASPTADHFPLLTKFIDANDNLSVQLHPNNEQAQELEGYWCGKTEMWYVIGAAEGAKVILGTAANEDHALIRQRIGEGRLEENLQWLAVSAGDVVYVPAGRVHALGRGLLVYEVQQNSDHTYRLYDWHRLDAAGKGRELHVEKGLRVLRFEQPAPGKLTPLRLAIGSHSVSHLKVSPYFAVSLIEADGGEVGSESNGGSFTLYTVLEGGGQLRWQGNTDELDLHQGDTVIVPAGLASHLILANGPLKLICTTLPLPADQLATRVVQPLAKAGYSATQIAQLLAAEL